jgi:hypothetical protein
VALIDQQLRDLETKENSFQFIVDTAHPLRFDVEKMATPMDSIVEIEIPEKVYEYMERSLPSEAYDAGLIFLRRAA